MSSARFGATRGCYTRCSRKSQKAREIPVQRDAPTDLAELSLADLEAWIVARGLPRFRARQIFAWVWKRGATSYDEMSDLGRTCGRAPKVAVHDTGHRPADLETAPGSRARLADRRQTERVTSRHSSQTFCVSTGGARGVRLLPDRQDGLALRRPKSPPGACAGRVTGLPTRLQHRAHGHGRAAP
jgi:hypothetical protein